MRKRTVRQLTKAEQWRVAYHEAGHAVAACKLEFSLGRIGVTIESRTGDDFLGRYGEGMYLGGWDGSVDGHGYFESQAVIALAGRAAQRRFRPESVKAYQSSGDYRLVAELHGRHSTEEYRGYFKRLKRRAAQLVKQHWPSVEAVAAALVQRKRLSTSEVRGIVRESCKAAAVAEIFERPEYRAIRVL